MLVTLTMTGAFPSLDGFDVSLHLVVKLLSFWTFLALTTTTTHLLLPILAPSDLFAPWLLRFTQSEEIAKSILEFIVLNSLQGLIFISHPLRHRIVIKRCE